MIVVTRVAIGGVMAATMLMSSQANAGCHGGSCGRGGGYRAPIVVRPIYIDPHHHHDGGPGGQGFGPGGGGQGGGQGQGGGGGQGGQGQGGQGQVQGGGQGQGGQGQGGQNGNQGQAGQNGQNGQNQNGQVAQNQNGQNQNQNGQNQNGQVAQNQNGQNQNQNQNNQNQNNQNQNNQNQNNQNQNNQNQNNQNQNGQNQNGQTTTTAVQVPSGSQITLSGEFAAQGQVYLNINNVKVPMTVDEWTNAAITVTLPAVQLTQAQTASIDVVSQGRTDSIAITLNPKARLTVNTQPQQPAGQGAGNGNLAATAVAEAQ